MRIARRPAAGALRSSRLPLCGCRGGSRRRRDELRSCHRRLAREPLPSPILLAAEARDAGVGHAFRADRPSPPGPILGHQTWASRRCLRPGRDPRAERAPLCCSGSQQPGTAPCGSADSGRSSHDIVGNAILLTQSALLVSELRELLSGFQSVGQSAPITLYRDLTSLATLKSGASPRRTALTPPRRSEIGRLVAVDDLGQHRLEYPSPRPSLDHHLVFEHRIVAATSCGPEPPRNFPNYPSGTWGPKESDELMERDGRRWRNFEK